MSKHLDEAEQAYDDGFQDGQAKLAEARAQIAKQDGEIIDLEQIIDDERTALEEARAQIAAKDAALRECLAWFDEPFESDLAKSDMEMAVVVRAALEAK